MSESSTRRLRSTRRDSDEADRKRNVGSGAVSVSCCSRTRSAASLPTYTMRATDAHCASAGVAMHATSSSAALGTAIPRGQRIVQTTMGRK